MGKTSGFALRVQAEKRAAQNDARRFAIQQAKDMLLIAAHDEFGFGKERLKRLGDAYDRMFFEYADLALDDASVDKHIEYTKSVIDRKLKEILGPYFVPWEERYR